MRSRALSLRYNDNVNETIFSLGKLSPLLHQEQARQQPTPCIIVQVSMRAAAPPIIPSVSHRCQRTRPNNYTVGGLWNMISCQVFRLPWSMLHHHSSQPSSIQYTHNHTMCDCWLWESVSIDTTCYKLQVKCSAFHVIPCSYITHI